MGEESKKQSRLGEGGNEDRRLRKEARTTGGVGQDSVGTTVWVLFMCLLRATPVLPPSHWPVLRWPSWQEQVKERCRVYHTLQCLEEPGYKVWLLNILSHWKGTTERLLLAQSWACQPSGAQLSSIPKALSTGFNRANHRAFLWVGPGLLALNKIFLTFSWLFPLPALGWAGVFCLLSRSCLPPPWWSVCPVGVCPKSHGA